MFTIYAKATVGAILAGLGACGPAVLDGHISLGEGVFIATAFFSTFAGVWAVPNRVSMGS